MNPVLEKCYIFRLFETLESDSEKLYAEQSELTSIDKYLIALLRFDAAELQPEEYALLTTDSYVFRSSTQDLAMVFLLNDD